MTFFGILKMIRTTTIVLQNNFKFQSKDTLLCEGRDNLI